MTHVLRIWLRGEARLPTYTTYTARLDRITAGEGGNRVHNRIGYIEVFLNPRASATATTASAASTASATGAGDKDKVPEPKGFFYVDPSWPSEPGKKGRNALKDVVVGGLRILPGEAELR